MIIVNKPLFIVVTRAAYRWGGGRVATGVIENYEYDFFLILSKEPTCKKSPSPVSGKTEKNYSLT